jgi:putative selenate reductase
MSELVPIPLDLQLRRAFLEYEREGKIFDLPRAKFFRKPAGLDMAVWSNGRRATTPLGPAAGPQTQLLQNIVLCWLGGARIIELKTVQVLDELQIPRPCIDARNVTYNVEWSQELKLEESLREYVSAAMFLQILNASGLLGEHCAPTDTIFDMSVGYNLEGLRSPRMRAWIEGMKDATRVIDELRPTLSGRFRQYRDLPFATCVSDTVTLSTFHGCPPEEIEGIVTFLLTEMDVHVCVKMNPTLLGKEQVRHLLHDVLGYRDIALVDEAFDKDLQFENAVELIPRLEAVARAHGKRLSVKFSNTLVVRNTGGRFADELMYMSGAPLHVLALNLVQQFRERVETLVPISFSAGLNAKNVANAVAMGFVPVTTCTDLLKAGGYGRLHRYGENLGEAMRQAGATTIPEFVVRYAGCGAEAIERVVRQLRTSLLEAGAGLDQWQLRPVEAWVENAVALRLREWLDHARQELRETCKQIEHEFAEIASDLPKSVLDAYAAKLANLEPLLTEAAALLNTPVLVERATADPRYRWEQNKAAPRKVGSQLALFDCLNCDKCVPVCPNNANFIYEAAAVEIEYRNYELLAAGGVEAVAGGIFKVAKSHQLANYADACNDCGNCDVFCPEDGGPNVEKPRFFGSNESFRQHAGRNGFYIEVAEATKTIRGIIAGKAYRLAFDPTADCARFEDEHCEYVIQPSCNALVSWRAKTQARPCRLDMLPYLQLKFVLDAVSDPRHVNYANVTEVPGS